MFGFSVRAESLGLVEIARVRPTGPRPTSRVNPEMKGFPSVLNVERHRDLDETPFQPRKFFRALLLRGFGISTSSLAV